MTPARRPDVEVVVYVREGCHLCDDALVALEALRAHAPFVVRAVDIESSDELHRRYLERIPVVAVAGEELGDFFVDAPRVLDAVRRAGAGGGRTTPDAGTPQGAPGGPGRADGAA